MEEKYFIVINSVQEGPYSVQELSTQHITLDTLVWKKGMDCWMKIADMPELMSALKDVLPPPMPPVVTNVNVQTDSPIQIELSKRKSENNFIVDTSEKFWKWLKKLIAGECVFLFKEFCCIAILGIILWVFFYVYTYPPYLSDKEQEEIRLELSKREPICEELLGKYKKSLDDYNSASGWRGFYDSYDDYVDFVNTRREKFEYDNEIIEKALQYKGYGIELCINVRHNECQREIIHQDLLQKYTIPLKIEKWSEDIRRINELYNADNTISRNYICENLYNYNEIIKQTYSEILNSILEKDKMPELLFGLFIGAYIFRVLILCSWSFVKWVKRNN